MGKWISVFMLVALMFSISVTAFSMETEIEALKAVDQTIGVHPSEWKDVVEIYAGSFALLGLRADGTVLSYFVPYGNAENYKDYYRLFCQEVSEWTDVQNLGIGYGLKKDGTALSVDVNLNNWKNISKIVHGTGWLAGLHEDGTVIVTEKGAISQDPYGRNYTWEDEWLDVSDWEDIIDIFPYYGWSFCNGLIGLKNNGTILFEHPSHYNRNDTFFCEYIYNWHDIVSVCPTLDDIYGLRKDGTVVAPPYLTYDFINSELEAWDDWYTPNTGIPSEWTNVKALYQRSQDDIFAVHNNGSVSAFMHTFCWFGFDYTIIQEWQNIEKLVCVPYGPIIGITNDGSVVYAGGYESGFIPEFLSDWKNIVDIGVGDYYIAGLTKDGTVNICFLENI